MMTLFNPRPCGLGEGPPALGYANGMLAKDGTLYVGGQIGWDKTRFLFPKTLSRRCVKPYKILST